MTSGDLRDLVSIVGEGYKRDAGHGEAATPSACGNAFPIGKYGPQLAVRCIKATETDGSSVLKESTGVAPKFKTITVSNEESFTEQKK